MGSKFVQDYFVRYPVRRKLQFIFTSIKHLIIWNDQPLFQVVHGIVCCLFLHGYQAGG